MTDHALWTPSTRRIPERIEAKPHWHCYLQIGNHTVVRRACGVDHRYLTTAQRCAQRHANVLNRRHQRHNPAPTARRRLSVRRPVNRHEALCDLEQAFALAMHAMGCDDDPGLHGVTVRQLRCDLHTLGVSTSELDAAGMR